MPLPILHGSNQPTTEMLVRYFHQTERHWTEHFAEPMELDVGVAFTNPSLPNVHDANRVLMASLPEGISAADALKLVEDHFAQQGVRCSSWTMNPSAPDAQRRQLVELLVSRGYKPIALDILYLRRVHVPAVLDASDLTIIPARASFRHARALAEEAAKQWNEPQLADAAMLHLDDPHWDALLALKDGVAVAEAGVLAAGEIGRIDDLFVAPANRHQGIARIMMDRILEICARSLFKHVFASCDPGNQNAQSLYRKLGFEKIGQFVPFHAPQIAK